MQHRKVWTFLCGHDVEQRLRRGRSWVGLIWRIYEAAFFTFPTVHEGEAHRLTTCNDDGLCRMLYFSDD